MSLPCAVRAAGSSMIAARAKTRWLYSCIPFGGGFYGGGGQHGEGAADLFLWDGRVTWETTATERERVGEALHRRRLLL